MKNLSLALNAVLIVAVGILYVLHFSNNSDSDSDAKAIAPGKGAIVYINTDSLLLNYGLSKDLNEKFLKKQEESRTDLNIKAKKLERDAAEFQRKLQNGGFLSRDRAEKAQKELLIRQQKLQQLERKLADELMGQQNTMNKRLHDSLTNFLTLYNAQHNYDLIMSTTVGGNVLHAKNGLDITNEVVTKLNGRYKK